MRPQVKAALGFLEKLVEHGEVGPADVEAVYAAGVSREGLVRAVHVMTAFTMITKIADALGFALLDEEGYDAGARALWKRGYMI